MAKRADTITQDSLEGLYRHHPYLFVLQKGDWSDYLQLLAQIYDILEEQGRRLPIDVVRASASRFYSQRELASVDQKVSTFIAMAIGELRVLRDSHDQFGQRYVETTREGKSLLQLFEALLSQRSKFSGTGAESLLGALNDILISRAQMTVEEALRHHKQKVADYREDIHRIQIEGLASAQLLPMAHSNEALFSQAEEASIHILQSIEDVKEAIEKQRAELASGYFKKRRSAGETLGTVADFYDRLYTSSQYASYIQAKELLSYLEGPQARFALRNVDHLLHSIENRELVEQDLVKRSTLRSFMHQFQVADTSIQEKLKAQIRILQQQVAYAVTTDVVGLRASLHELLANLVSHATNATDFFESEPLGIEMREEFSIGPVELFEYELPTEIASQTLSENSFDLSQERDLFLALLRAEEGTLKDILIRLSSHLDQANELRARDYTFPHGLAEYYVLSAIELFDENIESRTDGEADIILDTKCSRFVLRQAPAFILRRKGSESYG